jgi:hypothetical protein
MTKFAIKKATKEQSRLRMAIHGPSGAGKTFSALKIATNLGQRICLVDTETGSASKYGDKFDFDVCEINGDYHPDRLVEFLAEAPKEGYDVIVIDSGSHFWNGSGGFLELVDAEVKRAVGRGGKADSFNAWKVVDPVYKRLVHAIQTCKAHVIITLRAKTEYSKENGKVQKLGLAPEMRDNFQYEMDVEGMLDNDHNLVIGKTRCDTLDGKVFKKPGKDVAEILAAWLGSGAVRVEAATVEPENNVVDELVARLEAAKDADEIAAIKSDANKQRDRLGKDAGRVRTALEAAQARVA